MFQHLNYLETYEIDFKCFNEFLYVVYENYSKNNNPFHNFDHGFTGLLFIFFKFK